MDNKSRKETIKALRTAALTLSEMEYAVDILAGAEVGAGSMDTIIGRLKSVEVEIKQAISSAEKLNKDPARYAPQKDNLLSSLNSVMKTARVLIQSVGKISASVEISAGAVEQVARLVDRNDHSEAMAVAAEAIRNRKLAAAFRGFAAIAAEYGHMPNDLYKARYELYEKRLKPQLEVKAPEILQEL